MVTPPRLPLPLRNTLAELIVDALDVDTNTPATRDTAVVAIALLVTYDRLATAAAPVVDLDRLRAAPGNATADTNDDRGRDRLLATLLIHTSGPGGERGICLRSDFLPWLHLVGEHARRYHAVLDAAARLRVREVPGLSGVVARGAILFNAGLFYEVHEVLECAWRTAAGDQKTLLQGLVQIAVALYHHGQGNHRGARSLLHAGADKVESARAAAPPVIDLDGLLTALAPWRVFLDSGSGATPLAPPAPPLPLWPILTSERAGRPGAQ